MVVYVSAGMTEWSLVTLCSRWLHARKQCAFNREAGWQAIHFNLPKSTLCTSILCDMDEILVHVAQALSHVFVVSKVLRSGCHPLIGSRHRKTDTFESISGALKQE